MTSIDEIVRSNYQYLLNVSKRYKVRGYLPEDILHDALLSMLSREWEDETVFRKYATVAIRNKVIDFTRKKKNKANHIPVEETEYLQNRFTYQHIDHDKEAIREVIEKNLTRRQCIVKRLRERGYSYIEIEERLGVNRINLRTDDFRANKKLKEIW